MNNKGEIGVGTILVILIAIIACLALYQGVTQTVGEKITTVYVGNQTVTAGAANGTVELQGQNIVGTATVTNATSGGTVTANFTVAQGIGADGLIATIMTTGAGGVPYASQSVNVSYTYEPDGYMHDAGSRSIFALIVIFAALGVALIALAPSIREAVGLSR